MGFIIFNIIHEERNTDGPDDPDEPTVDRYPALGCTSGATSLKRASALPKSMTGGLSLTSSALRASYALTACTVTQKENARKRAWLPRRRCLANNLLSFLIFGFRFQREAISPIYWKHGDQKQPRSDLRPSGAWKNRTPRLGAAKTASRKAHDADKA